MKKVFRFTLLILLTVAAVSCKKDKESEDSNPTKNNPYLNPNLTYGSVADIDGNKYATIQIGNQVWMAENLKTTKYNDGTIIPNVVSGDWYTIKSGAWCYYDNESIHNNIYGKLYNWYAVKNGILCPKGWHIPTDEEWTTLANYLGGELVAGGKMRSVGNSWASSSSEATNESGFSGLPGGFHGYRVGAFDNIGGVGYWWSSTEAGLDNHAWFRRLGGSGLERYYYTYYNWGMNDGFSCRCVKD